MPLWVKVLPKERANQKIEVKNAVLSQINIKSAKYEATINSPEDTDVKINAIYFPGWQAKIDDRKVLIDYQNPLGLMSFQLPRGDHKVIIEYKNSGIHLASEIVSVLALILTGSYFIYEWRKQNS